MPVRIAPGRMALAVTAVLAELQRQGAGQAEDAGLGGAIGGQAIVGALGHHAGGADDPAGRRGDEVRDGLAGQAEDGAQIHRLDPVPGLVGHLRGQGVGPDAGVVEEDVEARRRRPAPRPMICAGASSAATSVASGCDGGRGEGEVGARPIHGQHPRALGGEEFGAGPADARGRAGDDRRAALESCPCAPPAFPTPLARVADARAASSAFRPGEDRRMIKLTFCPDSPPGTHPRGFPAYWFDHHAPLVASVREVLRIRRYVQRTACRPRCRSRCARSRGGAGGLRRRRPALVGQSRGHGRRRRDPAAAEAGRLLLEDERKFIDLARSPLWWGEEKAIF